MEALNERRVRYWRHQFSKCGLSLTRPWMNGAVQDDPATALLERAEKVLLDLFASEVMALEIPDPNCGIPHWNAARALLRDLRDANKKVGYVDPDADTNEALVHYRLGIEHGREAAKAEIERLRNGLMNSGRAVGAEFTEQCSTDFLMAVPAEILGVMRDKNEAITSRDTLLAQMAEALNEVMGYGHCGNMDKVYAVMAAYEAHREGGSDALEAMNAFVERLTSDAAVEAAADALDEACKAGTVYLHGNDLVRVVLQAAVAAAKGEG